MTDDVPMTDIERDLVQRAKTARVSEYERGALSGLALRVRRDPIGRQQVEQALAKQAEHDEVA